MAHRFFDSFEGLIYKISKKKKYNNRENIYITTIIISKIKTIAVPIYVTSVSLSMIHIWTMPGRHRSSVDHTQPSLTNVFFSSTKKQHFLLF